MPSSGVNEDGSGTESSTVNEGGSGVESTQRWAAFAMLLGPGSAMGFYLSMVGFYVANYKSRIFFLAMAFCAYIPGPVVSLLQQRFDAQFDVGFSAAVTYFFRVVVVQVLLAVVYLVWACIPQSPYVVLMIGVMIGFLAQAAISSSMQMVATMNPLLTTYAAWGNLCGGSMPVLVLSLSGFEPESRLRAFQQVILTVPALCVMSSAFLGYLHGSQRDVFQSSWDRIMVASRADVQDDDSEFETMPLTRQVSAEGEVPSWVWIWCSYNGISIGLSVTIVCLVAFFGAPELAQTLFLSKLATDIVGACVAVPLPKLQCFNAGPWHKTLAMTAAARIGLLAFLMSHLGGNKLSVWVLVPVWLLFHVIHATLGPHISVTIASYVHPSDRAKVQRTNQGCFFAGSVIGLLLAAAVIIPALGLGNNWPKSDHIIPAGGAASRRG